MIRDLSERQFRAALQRNGITPGGLGYYAVTHRPDGSDKLCVYARNAGPRRRSQLAYLLREQSRALACPN